MKMRTIGLSLFALAFAGLAPGQETKKEGTPAEEKKPVPAPAAVAGPRVAFETSLGNFVLELNPTKAPVTSKNFLSYVNDGFYNGTIFHRVISTFMIQGGGFELVDGVGTQKKPNAPIVNEAKNGLKNLRGAISMARTNNPNSATTQFFINVVDNAGLDPGGFSPDGYAVFGKIVEGMEVIDKIKVVKTGVKQLKARGLGGNLQSQPMRDVPLTNIVIKSAKVIAPKAK
jgi:peptidyl-prolyl cis-trans isomerase A (cyclophilin A)